MKVKDLLKMLKGQYTELLPFHTDHRNAIPYTQLGKEFNGLFGKEFLKVLGEKEVVEWQLGEWHECLKGNIATLTTKGLTKEKARTLTIYFK